MDGLCEKGQSKAISIYNILLRKLSVWPNTFYFVSLRGPQLELKASSVFFVEYGIAPLETQFVSYALNLNVSVTTQIPSQSILLSMAVLGPEIPKHNAVCRNFISKFEI